MTANAPPRIGRRVVAGCVLLALYFALYPVARSFFLVDIDYNEGWNIYNAQLLVNHRQLYPVPYGWQTVNYPMGSFALMAFLHRFTHDYLFTARFVSLLALALSCWLAGLIVRRVTRSGSAAILAAFLCLGFFVTNADGYIGMDDPQMLAQAVYLLAFYLYVRSRKGYADAIVVAAVFVVAGSIKHNPLDFPLAVLTDLLLLSWRRALAFAGCGIAFAAASVWLNIRLGGPFFISQMLAPRSWSGGKSIDSLVSNLGPLLIPLLFALLCAWRVRRDHRRRPLALLLVWALSVGTLFAGGAGVALNTYFTAVVAIAMLLGVGLADLQSSRLQSLSDSFPAGKSAGLRLPTPNRAAALLFAWLLIPALVAGVANPFQKLRETAEQQTHFRQRVALLRAQPAPVLCESLLECYEAGQPYVYDPFNATRLIEFGKLNPQLVLDGLERHVYGAVQLERHDPGDSVATDRFPAAVLAAIHANYRPALTTPEAVVWLPKLPGPDDSARK